MERRIVSTHEVRASSTGGKLKVGGYAARYGVLSHDLNGFKERIAKRAFDRVLRSKPDVVATFNHDANHVLGRTSAGTLQLRSDDNGLEFECDLPNTTAARDLHESVKRGDIKDMSFAFSLGQGDDEFGEEDDEENRGAKVIVRTIKNFKQLMDVALVTFPAYPNTSVAARKDIVAAEVRSHVATLSRYERSKAFVQKYPSLCGSMNIQANLENFYRQLDAQESDALLLARRRAFMRDILFS